VAAVGVDKVAKALNVTARRVQQLVKEGMPPPESRGKYDLAQCMLWYIRYLQKVIEKREAPEDMAGNSLRRQRERLVAAQAEREELELAEKKGEVVPIAVFEEATAKQITSARQHWLTMPSNIAHLLEGETRDVIKQRLVAEVRKILSSMSGQK
jgi:phage terminase Nu1 subunit (DNA packaging protein)